MVDRVRVTACSIIVGIAIWLTGISAARAGWCTWCPGNSATVGDKIVFDELNVNLGVGRPNGPKIVRATLNGNPVQLRVKDHYLSAVAGPNEYSGADLTGLVLALRMDDGRAYEAKLEAVRGCLHAQQKDCTPLRFWVTPFDEVPQYEFKIRKTARRTGVPSPSTPDRQGDDAPFAPGAPFKEHLCKGEYMENDVLWKNVEHSAIAFEGDHYDSDTKRVSETNPAEGWFNLACAGAAVMKMHLLRHTRAGSLPSYSPPRVTNVRQRTAMLKAITADYCGDGKAWTADGTPLAWTDERKWFPTPQLSLPLLAKQGRVEAVWGPAGALCLNVPRRKPRTSPAPDPRPTCKPPAVQRAEVVAACKEAGRSYPSLRFDLHATPSKEIPTCDPAWFKTWTAANDPTGAYVVTVNEQRDANYCDWP